MLPLRPRGFFSGVSFLARWPSRMWLALLTALLFRSLRYEFLPTESAMLLKMLHVG